MSRFLNSIFFTKERAETLKKMRVINTSLIHVQGFPKNFAKKNILKSPEYFGQYGKIMKLIISEKTNPDNKRKSYSAYITYSNKIEASLAILCVDSLMIKGKIIRAFFGTNKYCNYFLNNERCPNEGKCLFLHRYSSDKDIIINSNTEFTYNDHINLAKKILDIYNPKTIKLLQEIKKPEKNIFPTIDFIYLSEEEKENFLSKGDFTYVKGKDDIKNSNFFNINNININIYNFNNNLYNNIFINNEINNEIKTKLKNENVDNINSPKEAIELHKIFGNSIKRILLLKPFINKIGNKSIKKMEFVFVKNDLMKKGYDVDKLLYGCLDCIKDLLK